MKWVKIAELKDHLSRDLREAERGGQVQVTDRDRSIARIVPIEHEGPSIALIPPKRTFAQVRDERHGRARWGRSSTELLLEERQAH